MKKTDDRYQSICATIKLDVEAKNEERELMRDDQRFAAGDQWPDIIRKARETSNRPIQTVNRIPAFIDQIVGDARQNKPSIKIHPGEDGDADIALVYDGLVRAIQNESNADFAYDSAVENTANFGFGAWRVKTDYESEDSFNQVLLIERITDPLSVYFDKNSQQPDYSDARHVTVKVKITKDDYKERWKGHAESAYNFDDFKSDWTVDKDQVVVAEHWYKTEEAATLYALADTEGNVITSLELVPGMVVVQQRQTNITKVKMCYVSGGGILEEKEWAGKILPIVGVNGKEDLVDGKRTLRGIVRFAKDPQRMYNYWRTIDTEQKALAPKAPVLVSAKQIEGYEQYWQDALTTTAPYLIYNPDPSSPLPNRVNAGIVDKGANEAALMCVDELKSTTGIFSASLGEEDNEKSGRAILAQQRKGDTANFAYIDNVSRAIRLTGRILIEMIPKIYDSARVVSIMGVDGEKKLAKINQVDQVKGQPKMIDLTVGKYDLVVTQGASYATKRIEALNMLMELMRVNPAMLNIGGDLMMRAMDWDGSEEMADRLKKMLPPQLQENEGEQPLPPGVQGMIEHGKQMIDEMSQHIAQLEREKDDKDDELRLKKYQIDVNAEIEFAKLAAGAGLTYSDVKNIVNDALMTAAQQPELPEDDETVQHEQQEASPAPAGETAVEPPNAEQPELIAQQIPQFPDVKQNELTE